MKNAQQERVEEHWGDTESNATLRDISWMASPVVCRHLNRRVTGNPASDWLTWLDNLILRPRAIPLTCLVLGCGEGWLERALAPSPAIIQIDAMDVSPRAIETAGELATEHGLAERISYSVVNLDKDTLPTAKYDLVIAHSVLHHVEQLEHAYQQIEQALKPGGLFLINEYVGPKRLQCTDDQLKYINTIMKILPAHLRKSALTGEILTERISPPIDVVIATDPSEAIRSDEVVEQARKYFSLLSEINCGGTILQTLLYEIAPNFEDGNPDHDAILRLICSLEETLIEAGSLSSDYVFILAKRLCDNELKFQLPGRGDVSCPPVSHSPWSRGQQLPETGGFSIPNKYLNRRITGDPDQDVIEWCLQKIRRHRIRPLSSCNALLLEPSEFAAVLAPHFKKLEVLQDETENKGGYHLLFSVYSLFAGDLEKRATAKSLAQRLTRGGHLITLAAVRRPGEVPSPQICTLLHTVAANLPTRLGLRALPPVPPGSIAARTIDIEEIRSSLAAHFSRVEIRAIGGSILQVLLPFLVPHLHEQNADDRTLLDFLCLLDESWLDNGITQPDFVFVHAKK